MPASRTMNEGLSVDPGRRRPAASGESSTPTSARSVASKTVADDARALAEQERKRLAVGLSPRRPTAKEAPQRPPSVQTFPAPPMVLALILVGVVAITALLVWINLVDTRPAWWPAWGSAPTAQPVMMGDASTVAYVLHVGDDFSAPQSALRQGALSGEWRTELVPEQSIYRMTIWPNRLAWSLLGVDALAHYRLLAGVAIAATSPSGYAGLMVRHQTDQGFYFFAVDGHGRYSVQTQTRDGTTVLQAWTSNPALQPAPSANLLTVEDRGDQIHFYANQTLLYTLTGPELPVGLVGLAAGANGPEVAEVRFDWFQLYEAVTAR